ncbi:type II toxin-antitoxin system Phd/YefM family antitoxin [Pseudomonas citrulli]|uniref:Type II toxin-antitoxin system prevent-host-death family antitoxin n=1 Tax=Pseudomonas citrulli TaxID=3064347 RepID=A0ABT9C5R1_9PSED|nr:type II toxin-antitoxin system prevent-host-death family antitoxin [Pseudomonas sp. K18]MDO7900151.1 type II toxin-antitoxin system prevent-host-death family antitoxin [Pseudomonas sp. K18]
MSEQMQVTLREAKSQLLQLGARAWQGDRVVITNAGKPYLDLLPHIDTPQARKPGRLKGKIRMSVDFDTAPEDIIDGFEGRP